MNLAAGIAGLNTNAAATFDQCVTDVAINSTSTTGVSPWGSYDYHGGLLARTNSANVNITDCVCGGSVDGSSSTRSFCAGLVGVAVSCTVSATRCLSTASYTNVSSWNTLCHSDCATRSASVFYFVNGDEINVGERVTTLQLADATYAIALQDGRATKIWVQDGQTNQPMLLLFAKIAATLTDGEGITALNTYGGLQCDVNYSRSFTEGKASTVCLPFAYTKKEGDGSFYAFTGIEKVGSNYIATMTEPSTTTLTANTPYLYMPSATGSVNFNGTYIIPEELKAGSTTSGDWTYIGTYETVSWTTAPTGIYGFSAQNVSEQGISQGQFVKVGAYVMVKPMRCYLKYKSGGANYAGARGMSRATADEPLPETISVRLISANGDLNAIGTLHTKTGEVTLDGWYTLDGTRLSGKPTRKGIYVNNGKKIVLK